MDRIIYWQPLQNQTCTTQSWNVDTLQLAQGKEHTVEKLDHHIITFLPEHKVLLCTQCKIAVPSNDLDSHLRVYHKGIRKSSRESIRDTFTGIPVARITADLQPLPDGSSPSSFLIPPRRGFYCLSCSSFRSPHEREIRNHTIKIHGYKIKPAEVQKNACYLQGWVKRRIAQNT